MGIGVTMGPDANPVERTNGGLNPVLPRLGSTNVPVVEAFLPETSEKQARGSLSEF